MNTLQKLSAILLISAISISAYGSLKDERIRLKNGKGEATTTLNPSRTYKFVVNGKQFKKLAVNLKAGGAKLRIIVKGPGGKTLVSGTKTRFSFKNIGKGDYKIIVKNLNKSKAATLYIKIGDIDGD